jgi:TonB family protein
VSSRLLERPMLPHPTSRSAPDANAPPPLPLPLPDLALLLEQHVVAGFPADLALDLVLNELVARAADATHATAAALALLRGKQMVCRAATGLHAPDLGVPLDTRGLSGACVRSRAPQLSEDTECDPRIDPAVSRRLGIRSMLVVPVFDHKKTPTDPNPPLTGVLEVFSPLPNTFTQQAQILLTDFADECARIHNVATTLKSRPPVEIVPADDDLILSDTDLLKSDAATSGSGVVNRDLGMEQAGMDHAVALDPSVELVPSVLAAAGQNNTDVRSLLVQDELAWQAAEAELLPSSAAMAEPRLPIVVSRQPYEIWTLILGGLVILAAAAFSFMIGSRIGWLRSTQSASAITAQPADSVNSGSPTSSLSSSLSATGASAKSSAHGKNPERTNAAPQNKDSAKSNSHDKSPGSADQLVVYNNGKVVFRLKPTAAGSGTAPPQTAHARPTTVPKGSIWLAPTEAANRLITRTEPQYPAGALAEHRSGDVTLEVQVAEDGTVSSVNTLSGDPLLAAAATQAVRNWRYQPYRSKDRPSQFETDVTLSFLLPN